MLFVEHLRLVFDKATTTRLCFLARPHAPSTCGFDFDAIFVIESYVTGKVSGMGQPFPMFYGLAV